MKSGRVARIISLLWVFVAAIIVSACASFKPLPPQLSIVSVRPTELSFSEQKFGVLLRIRNPNQRDFVLNKLDYQLELSGAPFATGLLNQAATIPALGESVIEVPVSMRLFDFLNSAVGGLLAGSGPPGKGELEYRLTGTALLDGLWSVPFEKIGQVDIGKVLNRAK